MIDDSCAFTGHRPKRFSFAYNESDERCMKLKAALRETTVMLVDSGVRTFYSGMALGLDTWAAEIIIDLKHRRKDLCLIAVLPCETQASNWPERSRDRYFSILEECDEVNTLTARYTSTCMIERDRFMVDHAGFLIAVFDGGDSGGTSYTVRYALNKKRKIFTIHPDTLAVALPDGFVAPEPKHDKKVFKLPWNKKIQ